MTTWLGRMSSPQGEFPKRRKYGRRGRLVELLPADKVAVEYWRILLNDPCCYCGTAGPVLIDHITARARGGGESWENLTAACPRCNGSKLAQPWWRFVMRTRGGRSPDRPHAVLMTSAGQSTDRRALAGARHAREEQSRVRAEEHPLSLSTVDTTRGRRVARGGEG